MTKEIEDKNTDSTENAEDSTVETPVDKKENAKTFTQAELDQIVRNRVAKEKEASKKLGEDFTTEKANYEAQIASYEGIIKSMIDTKKKDAIPDNFLPLFEKMTIKEQFDFLNDEKNKLSPKQKIPVTPNAADETKQKPVVKPFRKVI